MRCSSINNLNTTLVKRYSLISRNLSAVLLALILNLNGLRVITGLNTILSYSIFFFFGVSVVASHIIDKRKWPVINIPLTAAVTLTLVFAAVYTFKSGGEELGKLFKFVVSILVALLSAQLDERQKAHAMYFTVGISAFYSLYAIVRQPVIFADYVIPKVFNYLDVTLPMGLGLTISLSILLLGRGNLRSIVLYLTAACVQIIGMLQYSARGNVLFPLLTVLFLLLTIAVVDRRKRLKSLSMIAVIVVAAIGFLQFFANPKLIKRLTDLLWSLESEPRIDIFRHYWSSISDPKTLMLGLGFGQSRNVLLAGGFNHYYPHNFALELIGELGVAGIALLVTSLFVLFRSLGIHLRRISQEKMDGMNLDAFLFSIAGFLFFLMNYSKSYSIFGGYQLFIFVSLLVVPSPRPPHIIDKRKHL